MLQKTNEARTAIGVAADRLRAIVLAAEQDSLIGSEEALIGQLGCSRSTVRQVARLLEREGLLRVKRGINGGYFGARPDAGTIEATVSAYLQTLPMDPGDVTILASALWVEALRKAAGSPAADREAVCNTLRPRFQAITEKASFTMIRDLELAAQSAIFDLANAAYIKLIFDINSAFSRNRFPAPVHDDDTPEHREFVPKWREAKLMELNAVSSGDRELAAMAAQYSRRLWYNRVGRRFKGFSGEAPAAI
jgi:GntR family transcriptional regulator, transcriptional repressor for pyruvate dehydrogenase complex